MVRILLQAVRTTKLYRILTLYPLSCEIGLSRLGDWVFRRILDTDYGMKLDTSCGLMLATSVDGAWGDRDSYYLQNWAWFGTALHNSYLAPFDVVR